VLLEFFAKKHETDRVRTANAGNVVATHDKEK
jgi:hypothetical protein